jgi:hypothetical protein
MDKKYSRRALVGFVNMSVPGWTRVALCFATAASATAGADLPTPPVRDGAAGYTVACSLVDQPGLHTCADLPSAAACVRELDFASQPSSERTGMTFVNRTDGALNIYWLDFQGNRRLYRSLSPGGHAAQPTFIGHNWLVATSDDRCIGIFKAAPQSLAFF